jgi:hypothetical protein
MRSDHIIIALGYNITSRDVELIANTIEGVIKEVFETIGSETEETEWLSAEHVNLKIGWRMLRRLLFTKNTIS